VFDANFKPFTVGNMTVEAEHIKTNKNGRDSAKL
jgi:hypothetical protein